MGNRVPPIAFGGDDGLDCVTVQFVANNVGIIAIGGQQSLDPVSDHVKQWANALNVMALHRRQDRAERPASADAPGVEFGAEATAQPAKRLGFLSPLYMPTAL